MSTQFYSRSVIDPYLDYQSIYYSDVSKSDYSFLAVATKLAATSDNRFRVGALVVKSGRVFGGRANITKRSPSTPPNRFSTHAEIAALIKIKKPIPKHSKIYISRVGFDGKAILAAPCPICQHALMLAGISEIYHT